MCLPFTLRFSTMTSVLNTPFRIKVPVSSLDPTWGAPSPQQPIWSYLGLAQQGQR